MKGLVLVVALVFYKSCNAQLAPQKPNCDLWIWNSTKQDFVNFFTKQSLVKNALAKTKSPICLTSTTIQVLAQHINPYLSVDSETGKLTGFLGDYWNLVEEFLMFRSNIIQVNNYSHGINELLEDKADVYLAAIVYTNQTKSMILSDPYFLNWYNLYLELPEGKPGNYLHFRTFTTSLWMQLFLNFLLSTVLLWTSCFLLRKVIPKLETIYSLPTFFLGVLAAFFNAGYDLKLRCYSTRLQIFVAQFFGVACCYALSAILVARLSVVDQPSPFTGLYDFPKQDVYSLCLRNITFVYDSLTDGNNTLLPQWLGKVNTDQCPESLLNLETILEHLCKNKVAVLESRILMGVALKKNASCQINLLPHRYFVTGNHIAFSRNFKKEPIKIMLLRIRSSGISHRIERKWVLNEIPNYASTTAPKQITLAHVTGLIFIYLSLIGVSLIILTMEMVINKCFGTKFIGVKTNNGDNKI